MSDPTQKRMIEELIPLTEIGIESSKSVSYGDIHAIHTWFARRPLPACRAATFAALVNAPKTEAERDKLLDLIIETLGRKAPRKHPDKVEEMRHLIRETFDGDAPRVLDPFAGGGSLPLEAARLGCETYAQDLNPNAVLTLLGTVDYVLRFSETQFPLPSGSEDPFLIDSPERATGDLVEAVEQWGNWVEQQVRAKLHTYYPDTDDNTVVAYFWAKTIRCVNPSCRGEIPLIAHRWLSKRKGKTKVAFRLLPQEDRSIRIQILYGDEARTDKPSQGTMASGSVQCPYCPQTVSSSKVKAQFTSSESGRLLLALAYKVEGESGVSFRPANAEDRADFSASVKALERAEAEHSDPFFPLVPDEELPKQSRGNNLVGHQKSFST